MPSWISALLSPIVVATLSASVACGGAPPRPQVAVEASGTHYAPLPPRAPVTVYKRRQEPEESYREIGNVTASCPETRWVDGRQEKGLRVCLAGLKQGARMLGGQGVVSVSVQRIRPSWDTESPWLVMRGQVIRIER